MAAPRLCFTDLASGPNTGNTDTSKGQTPGQHGAIVTVWGQNLGATQGASKVFLGGVEQTTIYYWGPAIAPWSPANLNNGYHRLQCIIFQVLNTTPTGAQDLSVLVGGLQSIALVFTVRAGRIFFVSPTGNDGAAGTYQAPFLTMIRGKNVGNQPGDTIYTLDGVNQVVDTEVVSVAIRLNAFGTQAAPIALVAFPGATCQIGTTFLNAIDYFGGELVGSATYRTVAKFTLYGDQSVNVGSTSGERIVGCWISCPNGNTRAGALNGRGNDLNYLGNEFTNCGVPLGSAGDFSGEVSLYHTLYIAGYRQGAGALESGRVIAWNYFHDNNATRAINIYNGEPGNPNIITGHLVHDNVVTNQKGDAIGLLGGVVGENWIYNNLGINVGLGPQPQDQGTSHVGLNIRAWSGIVHVFNNTFLNCGQVGLGGDNAAFSFAFTANWIMDGHNNIFAQSNGLPYFSPLSEVPNLVGGGWSRNLYFGAGSGPAFDTSPVNADPLFVSSGAPYDLHLLTGSQAIGAGLPAGIGPDFDGNPRPASDAWTIGAYHVDVNVFKFKVRKI